MKKILTILNGIILVFILSGCTTESATIDTEEDKRTRFIHEITSSEIQLPKANIGQYGVSHYLAWDKEEFDSIHEIEENDLCLLTDDEDLEYKHIRSSLSSWERYGIYIHENNVYKNEGTYTVNLHIGFKERNMYGTFDCDIQESYEITFTVKELLVTDEEYIESKSKKDIDGAIVTLTNNTDTSSQEEGWKSSTNLFDWEIKLLIEELLEEDTTAPYCRFEDAKGYIRGSNGIYWIEKDLLQEMSGNCDTEIRNKILEFAEEHQIEIEFR